MKITRILVALGLAGSLISSCMPAGAQELSGRAALLSETLPVGMPETGNHPSDVFLGTNTKGPYTLSWKSISKFSEQVTVDGQRVQRTLDYDVDYASGTITFTNSIASTHVLRVEYSYDLLNGVKNANPVSMPLQFDLLAGSNSDLKFTGVFGGGSQASGTSPLSVYGISGSTKTSFGNFTTMLLTAPDSGNGAQNSMGDRTALKLGGTTTAGILQLDTSYTHVGQNFASAKNYNLQQGIDALSIGATLTPTKGLSLTSSLNRSESLIGNTQGLVNTTSLEKLAYSTGSSKLEFAHTQNDSSKDGQSVSSTTADQLRIAQTISASMSATASHESLTTTGASTSSVTTDTLALTAKPIDNLSMGTQFTQKNSSAGGTDRTVGLNVDASPTKALNVKAAINSGDSEKNGKDTSESLALTANPNKTVSLNINVAHDNADTTGEAISHAFTLVTRPRADTNLELGLTGMSSDTAGDRSTRSVKFQTSAVKNTTLQANWSQMLSTTTGQEQDSGVIFTAVPSTLIKLSGAYAQKLTASALQLKKEARLELTPFTGMKLGGAYSEVADSGGALVARTTEVNASTPQQNFMALSGGYKTRLSTVTDDPDTMNVAVKLAPVNLFAFTGAYAMNPEDVSGTVQRLNSRSLGLNTNLGRLCLKGAYTWSDQYLVGHRTLMTTVAADIKFSPTSLLSTSYSLESDAQQTTLQTQTYALTFSHQVGSEVNVYLTGRAKLLEKAQQFIADQSEYEAEARLGLKF